MSNYDENIKLEKQARRWCFTINHPFAPDEEINPETSDLPIKEDYYSKKSMLEVEEKGCFIFKYVKVPIGEDEFETKDYLVKRPFFKDLESAKAYLQGLEGMKYLIFQIEKGENEQTEHIQGFITFTHPKRFQTMKNILPIAHLEEARGTSVQCRDYCSKPDTRVVGPFEFGTFDGERERTDVRDFVELAKAGASKEDICRLFPSLFLKSGHRIDAIYATQFEKYKNQCRDVKVTYIYGKSGVGKTTKVRREFGVKDAFWVHMYDNSMFTHYNGEDTLVLDEFTDNMKIQNLNLLLNKEPVELRGLNCLKYGAYHNVYIISNYAPTELYKEIQATQPDIFQTFYRRLHTIIHIDENGVEHIKRETKWVPATHEEDLNQGITEQIKEVIEYDENGNETIVFKNKDIS